MRVLISGATGFLGSHLVPFLREHGYEVSRLTRRPTAADDLAWDPAQGKIDLTNFPAVDAVVHLAGENIADGRWTDEKKQRIRDSRILSTRLLSKVLAGGVHRPQVFISASAVGYYGDRGDQVVTEESESGEGFLAEVCRQWEAETQPAVDAGIRTVHLRNGLVLAADGGALHTMLLPFKSGLGGPVGSGQQYWSWISLPDWLHVILHCIGTQQTAGPLNATAPNPVRNTEFTDALGRVLHRPTLVPVPAFMLRLTLGEMADEMLLASARVMPSRLQACDYRFTHETIDEALRALL
ncbi:MAG: TIGR01777 family oxidoreductase [Candidatus Binatia bacterium]